MKKEKIFGGYQVRTKDLTGISFQDYSLETCKRYCRKGYVVVSTYRKCFGIEIRISWMKWYKPFQFVRFSKRFNILWLNVSWNYLTTERPDKVVWEQ